MTRHTELVQRLCQASGEKHFDAYADVDWDHPDHQVNVHDPIWELSPNDGLGATDWYRSQPGSLRAQIGAHLSAHRLKLGLQFEGVLSRGLLELAAELPDGALEFRYAYHEVIEEGQHTLMFQELVNRIALPVPRMNGADRWTSRRVQAFGRTFPEMFLFFVLGGEAPIDHLQRAELASGRPMHPLLRRVMRIHVIEEARHICFAESYLRETVPRLGAFRMLRLRTRVPILLAGMSAHMMKAPRWLARRYRIPRAVMREAYVVDPRHRQRVQAQLASVVALCGELAILTPRWQWMWRMLGLLPSDDVMSEP